MTEPNSTPQANCGKRAYQSPEWTDLGTIEDLTQVVPGPNPIDNDRDVPGSTV